MDFRTVINGASSGTGVGATGKSGMSKASPADDIEALFANLMKEARKTPEERAREGVLKKHNMSEDDYRRMPQAQRDGIDREIAQEVRRIAEMRRAGMAARNGAIV